MIQLHDIQNVAKAKRFFITFYIVGVIGMLIPYTLPFFIVLIPFSLLLNFVYLALFHSYQNNVRTALVFVSIFIAGLAVEIVGVSTGLVFGEYHYGAGLGLKLYNTPILIGMNWLFMVYVTSSVFEKLLWHPLIQIVLASLAMVLYDIVLEQVAPKLDMWHWKQGSIPLQNYVVWFVCAVVFHSVVKLAKIKTANPLSLTIFLCQFLFFVCLSICM